MKAKYTIIEKNEEVPALSKIEKSDFTVEITLNDTVRAFESNKKGMEAIEADIRLKKAIRTNIEVNHPEIMDIDEKTQMMCHTYYEAGRFVKLGEDKLAEFQKAQREIDEEIQEIEKQTGLTKADILSNLPKE